MRSVSSVITSISTKEGGGFSVRRPFPTRELGEIDPFLLLDHMEPKELGPGQAVGAPDHPHRGFETVTYMLEGSMVHKDSAGNSGRLNPGDVQWMTAGSGVIHSEMPSEDLLKNGGKMHGFQLWVNLPKRDKMIRPRYQDTPASRIPTAVSEDKKVEVRVIAGESLGTSAVIQTRTSIIYLHIKMAPHASFEQTVPRDFNAFVYTIAGSVTSDTKSATADQLLMFNRDGDSVQLKTGDESADFLLIAGEPLEEPIARYGPFVMNTRSEIIQALNDYNSGQFGEISH